MPCLAAAFVVFTSTVFREEAEKNWTYVQYICAAAWNYGGAESCWNFWGKRDARSSGDASSQFAAPIGEAYFYFNRIFFAKILLLPYVTFV